MEKLQRPRPFCDWHEDYRDVLWWRSPISEPPYVGTPLDLGHEIEIQIGDGVALRIAQVGGWPFDEADQRHLWWTPLPDANAIEDQIPL